jgi:hypothetical protein
MSLGVPLTSESWTDKTLLSSEGVAIIPDQTLGREVFGGSGECQVAQIAYCLLPKGKIYWTPKGGQTIYG